MQSKKFGAVFLAGLSVTVMATMAAVKAQPDLVKKTPEKTAIKTMEKNANPAMLPLKTGNRGVQVIDITEANTVWPRTHLVYDFDRNTVALLTINTLNGDDKPMITIHEIKSLAMMDLP